MYHKYFFRAEEQHFILLIHSQTGVRAHTLRAREGERKPLTTFKSSSFFNFLARFSSHGSTLGPTVIEVTRHNDLSGHFHLLQTPSSGNYTSLAPFLATLQPASRRRSCRHCCPCPCRLPGVSLADNAVVFSSSSSAALPARSTPPLFSPSLCCQR